MYASACNRSQKETVLTGFQIRVDFKALQKGKFPMNRPVRLVWMSVLLLSLGLVPDALATSLTSSGCFTPGTGSACSSSVNFPSLGNGDPTLSFTGTSLSNVVSGMVFSLGSFTFTAATPVLSGYIGQFTLSVDFNNPQVNGGLVGSVLGGVLISSGGVVIKFTPGSQVFNYSGGSFTLDLDTNPIVVGMNHTVQLDATIVNLKAPEGSGLAMLALSGIVTLGAIGRKARRLARTA
jgi:hypothetical protein